MGHIGLEKTVAWLRDTFGYANKEFVLVGDAALVVHGVIKEVTKPVIMVSTSVIKNIAAQRGIPLKDSVDEVYGKVHYIDLSTVLLIAADHLPRYHCTTEHGPFTLETLSTIAMLLCVNGITKNSQKINNVFAHGGYLLLEVWESDLNSIDSQYGPYPEYYEIIDGCEAEGERHQVLWKTTTGIEVAKEDHIFLEYVGMMYVDAN